MNENIMLEFDLIAITPFLHPDPHLVVALSRTDGLGVLDPTFELARAHEALTVLNARAPRRFGVVARPGILPSELPQDAVIVLPGPDFPAQDWTPRPVLAQVTSLDEARIAEAAGAAGLIAKGLESGGRVGSDTAFILLQRLVEATQLPIWVQGGIGLHTAAACLAGGARGVVIDSQLALARESRLPDGIKQIVASMDGSETVVKGGYRIYRRPDRKDALPEDPLDVADRLGAGDLERDLLPCGQDAALAAGLALRHVTAGGIVTGLLRAMHDTLAVAKNTNPLSPGAPLAAYHGTVFPVLQGPMTRVSDTAGFADAVAKAGGLPFIAIALLRGETARKVLRETSTLLGERPWGVGILGFVDAELRAEQLAVIEEIRPPVALIAGGRPSQARALEDQGIATYLHVPSPGLLKLFLSDGARRFIFEGKECGGHVGPRPSFLLWEQQLEILSGFDRPEELCVVFAGGIHNERSAAMVSALATPLAARGAKIGILMGTAYLFTQEAVATGAILPTYQRAAIDCQRTVLLETAPGHATRCVDSPYVQTFTAERLQLEQQGASQEQVWRHLERLNLGRLRIASKGIRRDGDARVCVDDAEQQRDGMYMIGDVAMLREQVTTVEDLHQRVSQGASQYLANLPDWDRDQRGPEPVDIAIVGMAAVFPGAGDTDTFWSNIVKGIHSISEVDPTRWNPEIYFDPDSRNGDKTPTKWGGFLDDVVFNPMDYGIPPQSLTAIDPTQLLSLEVARRALQDAGYATREFDRSRVSVVFGAESGADISATYGFRALYPQLVGDLPPALDDHLPRLTEDSFPGVLANVIAGRIANRLDLGGSNFTVDAACASSLAALDMAVKELGSGTSDMVLCGGADLHNGINDYLLFAGVHALSRSGRCKTFDGEADGTVLGEGVACLVLKRLADAERDGDRIYAIVKSVAASSDGRSLGLTAPRKEGQIRALERAYARAGLSPQRVGLVEAHGTGTVVGDRTEIASLTETFRASGAVIGSCGLGSVKSQIGHTKCAAGLAGLIKVTKALYHRVLPPTINISQPNPAFDPDTSPFFLSDRARPWMKNERHGAVSAFGFGGSNYHAVLSAYVDEDEPESGFPHWPCELFLFRGSCREDALEPARKVLALLGSGVPVTLRDLAASVCSFDGQAVQFSIVASSLDELRTSIETVLAGRSEGKGIAFAREIDGKLAFLFPGQGSQRPGMLRELFVAFPQLHRLLDLGAPWLDAMFPPTAWTEGQRAQQKAAIMDTQVAQPALGIAGLAIAELYALARVQPDMAGGHSYGELVALCLSGVYSEHDLLELSRERAAAILDAGGGEPGSMAAVSAEPEQVLSNLEGIDGVVIANLNAPDQTVVSGPREALDLALHSLESNRVAARLLPVAAAFHSPLVAAASARIRTYIDGKQVRPPKFPVWSNTSSEPYPEEPETIRDRIAEHIAKPVRFTEQIESMYAQGARIFVEAGPGRVLSSLVSRILGDREHLTIASDTGGDTGIHDFLTALGRLSVLGIPVDTQFLFSGRGTRPVDFDDPHGLAFPATAWKINGWLARPMSGDPPKNRLRPTLRPVCSAPMAIGSTSPERDTTMVEYLRNLRELATAQRDVMLGYLGVEPATVARPIQSDQTGKTPETLPEALPTPELRSSVAPAQPLPVTDALLGIVSEKTGYPIDMLGLDLDLEAELSIDSIKRVEILGALAGQLGLGDSDGDDRDYVIEQLAARKTLREILNWIQNRSTDTVNAEETPRKTSGESVPGAPPVHRYLPSVRVIGAAAGNRERLAGKRFLVTDSKSAIAKHLITLLQQHGAVAYELDSGLTHGVVDGLLYLGAVRQPNGIEPAKELFDIAKQAIGNGASWILALTGLGGRFGHGEDSLAASMAGGIAGLIKSIAKENPGLRARIVDIDPREQPLSIAESILIELTAEDGLSEVGYAGGQRYKLVPVIADITDGSYKEIGLDENSVVLVTGGARGITAAAAVELAQRTHCRLVLVGRSPPPGPEDPEYPSAPDLATLRRQLIENGRMKEPKVIEAECRHIMAAREVRATFDALRAAGARFEYQPLDVRDGNAFGALIDDVYSRHGSIDAVIHGAGVIEDKLMGEKTRDSFDRVYDTKVSAAQTLMAKLREDVRYVVFFSSISGAFGNGGQTDYAAAGDTLDKLAQELGRRITGRVVSIDWGPWAGIGMVSDELAREYGRRGMGLIPLSEGVDLLMLEMGAGPMTDNQVIWVAAEPAALAAQFWGS